jgi:hypothetical protein
MVECRGSRVIGRGSEVEVEGPKSRSRVKGRGSKVEGQFDILIRIHSTYIINTFIPLMDRVNVWSWLRS